MNVAIIGTGIAGVAAAKTLAQAGVAVRLFDKSRGFGGRCASKRWEGHVLDHGAQYFTMRDAEFRDAVNAACGESLRRISAPIVGPDGNELPDTGRYYHGDGNSRLARDLACGLDDVHLGTEVTTVVGWLRQEGGDFDHVVSTAPWPQTARLFGVENRGEYLPCLAALFSYQGEWIGKARSAYGTADRNGALAWTACENHKEGRVAPGCTAIVAHMSAQFSLEHLERDPAELPALIRPLLEERLQIPPGSEFVALGHRWRFARVETPIRPVSLTPGLHFAGDALRASRIEDAWLAGRDAARRILRMVV